MENVQMHLHLSAKAAQLLEKYCSPRGRGAFLSDLVIAYDREQKDGQGVIEALRKRAKEAQIEASRAQNALKAMEELHRGKR